MHGSGKSGTSSATSTRLAHTELAGRIFENRYHVARRLLLLADFSFRARRPDVISFRVTTFDTTLYVTVQLSSRSGSSSSNPITLASARRTSRRIIVRFLHEDREPSSRERSGALLFISAIRYAASFSFSLIHTCITPRCNFSPRCFYFYELRTSGAPHFYRRASREL